MSDTSKCGPHTQIATTEHVRISQCPCGTYHVSFNRKGVTIQLGLEDVKALMETTGTALRVADAEARGKLLATGTSSIN